MLTHHMKLEKSGPSIFLRTGDKTWPTETDPPDSDTQFSIPSLFWSRQENRRTSRIANAEPKDRCLFSFGSRRQYPRVLPTSPSPLHRSAGCVASPRAVEGNVDVKAFGAMQVYVQFRGECIACRSENCLVIPRGSWDAPRGSSAWGQRPSASSR